MLITLSESHCSAFAVTETPTIDRQLSGVELSGIWYNCAASISPEVSWSQIEWTGLIKL